MSEQKCVHSAEVMMMLGRIQEKCEDNGRHITAIETALRPLQVEAAIAKRIGASEGRKWGAIVGGLVGGLAAVVNYFVG